jgi:tRNA(fMet)-specific endonuclease VapC
VILLDTNVCIAVLNRRPASVLERLQTADPHRNLSKVSVVSVFELRFGAEKSERRQANSEALDAFLRSIEILAFDARDAAIAASIRAGLEATGRPIGPYDYLIAGQAIRHGLTLITANQKEFRRVQGLKSENWVD